MRREDCKSTFFLSHWSINCTLKLSIFTHRLYYRKINLANSENIAVQKFGVSKVRIEITTFIQQGNIKLSDFYEIAHKKIL